MLTQSLKKTLAKLPMHSLQDAMLFMLAIFIGSAAVYYRIIGQFESSYQLLAMATFALLLFYRAHIQLTTIIQELVWWLLSSVLVIIVPLNFYRAPHSAVS